MNEDAWFTDDARGVYLVADGMGGHAAGEVAARMAIERVGEHLCRLRDERASVEPLKTGIVDAVERANLEILQRAAREPDKRGMGTTLTALVLVPEGTYLIGQVGDSRAYRLRSQQLDQLTKDHTVVQERVDLGLLTPEQARIHPLSHILTRALGIEPDVEVDLLTGALEPGDVFLLASDGLSGMLSDEEIREIVMRGGRGSLGAAAQALVEAAKREGGLDNVTVVLVKLLDED